MFDRFDICIAYNLYSQHYGWCPYTNGIQARLAEIRFRPGISDEYLDTTTANAREIYLGLVKRHQTAKEYRRAKREIEQMAA